MGDNTFLVYKNKKSCSQNLNFRHGHTIFLRVFLADFKYQGIQLVAELVHGSLEPYQKIKGNDYWKAYGADSR